MEAPQTWGKRPGGWVRHLSSWTPSVAVTVAVAVARESCLRVCPAPSSGFAAGLGLADKCEMGRLKERTIVRPGDLQTSLELTWGGKMEGGDP